MGSLKPPFLVHPGQDPRLRVLLSSGAELDVVDGNAVEGELEVVDGAHDGGVEPVSEHLPQRWHAGVPCRGIEPEVGEATLCQVSLQCS